MSKGTLSKLFYDANIMLKPKLEKEKKKNTKKKRIIKVNTFDEARCKNPQHNIQFRSVTQSHPTLCGLKHARIPCPSPTPGSCHVH